MDFVELAAIDNDRYIIYGESDVATFDNDNILVVNLNTLTKMHPDSDEFKSAMDRISKCLPNMLIRLADPDDVELFEELNQYKYSPTQIHGFDVMKFLNEVFDYTNNQSLKESYESLDPKQVKLLSDFFDSETVDNLNKLNKALKESKNTELQDILEELDVDVDNLSPKKVYEINVLDLIEKDSPLKQIVKETFDLAKDDAMRSELQPIMKKLMGEAYKNVYYSSKYSNLYIFTDPRLKKVNQAKWWPNQPLDSEGWKKLYSTDEDFKKTIDNNNLRPKNSRLWEIPLDSIVEEKEVTDIIMKNQSKLRGHEMKEGMEPWFRKELGGDYLDMFIEPGSNSDRKVYIFVEPDSNINIKSGWWPRKPITNADYIRLSEKWEGFKKIDQNLYGEG